MNKRIQVLAEHCRTEYLDEEYGGYIEQFDEEKFAELIVRECTNIDFRARVGLSREDDREVSRVIKEHFGVEG